MSEYSQRNEQYNEIYKEYKDKTKTEIDRCPFCSLKIMLPNQLTCGREQCSGDRRLMTWDKWAKTRKKEATYLGDKTDRPQVDLVMNLVEKVREEKEKKIVFENAKIQTKSKIRGGTLWERPDRLSQTCSCKPVYEVHRTPEEKGKSRVIHHIGIPQCIQSEEMGVFGKSERPKCENLDFEYAMYKEKREKELKTNIEKIDPYKYVIKSCQINYLILVIRLWLCTRFLLSRKHSLHLLPCQPHHFQVFPFIPVPVLPYNYRQSLQLYKSVFV